MDFPTILKISDLTVSIEQKQVLNSVNLEVLPSTIHVLMGPNGSGKSTFAQTIIGHPSYAINYGLIQFNGQNINELSIDKRAQEGIFLAFQNPVEIPGVTVFNFLKEAFTAIRKQVLTAKEFQKLLFEQMDNLNMDHSFAYRNLNDGFSGGEKKRLEILQLLILSPKIALLDEIDSGLDVDAVKIVAQGLMAARTANPEMSIILITHYPRLLQYISPDFVHVMSKGKIVRTGCAELAQLIEERGYDAIRD